MFKKKNEDTFNESDREQQFREYESNLVLLSHKLGVAEGELRIQDERRRGLDKELRSLQAKYTVVNDELIELRRRFGKTIDAENFTHKLNNTQPFFRYTKKEQELLVLVKDKIRDIFWDNRIGKELEKEELTDTTNHRVDGLRIDLDYYVKKLEENIQGLSDRVDDLELEDNE